MFYPTAVIFFFDLISRSLNKYSHFPEMFLILFQVGRQGHGRHCDWTRRTIIVQGAVLNWTVYLLRRHSMRQSHKASILFDEIFNFQKSVCFMRLVFAKKTYNVKLPEKRISWDSRLVSLFDACIHSYLLTPENQLQRPKAIDSTPISLNCIIDIESTADEKLSLPLTFSRRFICFYVSQHSHWDNDRNGNQLITYQSLSEFLRSH